MLTLCVTGAVNLENSLIPQEFQTDYFTWVKKGSKGMMVTMDKWTKIGAIVGGVWGLLTGILYAWGVFAAGFSGHEFGFPEGLEIVCLPVYLTHLISTALKGILSFLLFIAWFVGMPTFFGIMIGIGIGILITMIVKKVS